MSTNYYLRATRPRIAYDEFHIGKTSWGRKPHFQDSENVRAVHERVKAPEYHSVSDIQALIESGEYVLVDEYGEPASLADILTWGTDHPDWEESIIPGSYYDPDGNLFTYIDFV